MKKAEVRGAYLGLGSNANNGGCPGPFSQWVSWRMGAHPSNRDLLTAWLWVLWWQVEKQSWSVTVMVTDVSTTCAAPVWSTNGTQYFGPIFPFVWTRWFKLLPALWVPLPFALPWLPAWHCPEEFWIVPGISLPSLRCYICRSFSHVV